MVAVIQRVAHASVTVDGKTVGEIGRGLLILLGVRAGDTDADRDYLLRKLPALRIFEDENGKMNQSVLDIGGSALVISNFTLLANTRRGNRPDFLEAARPEISEPAYRDFCDRLSAVLPVERGVFGADMKVDLLNDGPVTIVMDSADRENARR